MLLYTDVMLEHRLEKGEFYVCGNWMHISTAKKDEMIEDLKTLVRIDSQRGRAKEGKPFGDGPATGSCSGRRTDEAVWASDDKL